MKIDITFGQKEDDKKYLDRVGAYLIAETDGRIAVIKTAKGYFLPGGGIDENESHIQCIEREVFEEIGCECAVKKYLCSAEEYIFHEKIGYFHPIQYYYTGKIGSKIQEPTENDHALVWIDIQFAAENMHSAAQKWAVMQFLSHGFHCH